MRLQSLPHEIGNHPANAFGAEFRDLALRLDLGDGELAALRLRQINALARARTELQRDVTVLVRRAVREHLAARCAADGVRVAVQGADSDEPVWLSVGRPANPQLPPKAESPWLWPWLEIGDAMLATPTLAVSVRGDSLIAAGTHRDARSGESEGGALPAPTVERDAIVPLESYEHRAEVERQLAAYLRSQWQPWAEAEQARRRRSRVYMQFISLHQELTGPGSDGQLELLWGVGLIPPGGDEKADLAVGPTASPVALAMLPVAEEYKKILLVEPAVADSITGDKWNKYIFRTGRNSSQDAISNAVALDKKDTVIATLAQDYAFGRDGVKAFKDAIKTAKIVHEEYLPTNTTDFTAGAQRLIDKLKDQPGKKYISVAWSGAPTPFPTPKYRRVWRAFCLMLLSNLSWPLLRLFFAVVLSFKQSNAGANASPGSDPSGDSTWIERRGRPMECRLLMSNLSVSTNSWVPSETIGSANT